MVEREDRDQKEKIFSSGLGPFRYSLYRAFWFAALFSYIGAAMYEVAPYIPVLSNVAVILDLSEAELENGQF